MGVRGRRIIDQQEGLRGLLQNDEQVTIMGAQPFLFCLTVPKFAFPSRCDGFQWDQSPGLCRAFTGITAVNADVGTVTYVLPDVPRPDTYPGTTECATMNGSVQSVIPLHFSLWRTDLQCTLPFIVAGTVHVSLAQWMAEWLLHLFSK